MFLKPFPSFSAQSLNEQSKSKRIMFNIREDLNKPNVRMQQYSQFFKVTFLIFNEPTRTNS